MPQIHRTAGGRAAFSERGAGCPAEVTLLEGKVALVMGASRGIGAEIARAYAAAGAGVVLAARDERALLRVADEIEGAGGHAIAVRADVSSEAEVRAAVHVAVDEFGRLDVATNNAAGGAPPTPLADLQLADFEQSIQTNLVGGFLALKHEIAAMLENDGPARGAIVNISSTAGLEGVANLAGYSATKHALIGLTKVAALDYAERGIRVNAVAPGPILTHHLERAGEKYQRMAAEAMPMRRIGMPSEVGDAVVWLSSHESSFVTGTTVVIDGGKMAGTPAFSAKAREMAA
jgi:NAD(P)-dependent dehydrogenase (short-subunit alcohol dehydrogenase family)